MSDPRAKFSPETKLSLSELASEENPLVRALIRTSGDLEEGQLTELKTIGAKVGTIAGDIVTIVLHMRSLPGLASLEFVRYIELASPLFPESESSN